MFLRFTRKKAYLSKTPNSTDSPYRPAVQGAVVEKYEHRFTNLRHALLLITDGSYISV